MTYTNSEFGKGNILEYRKEREFLTCNPTATNPQREVIYSGCRKTSAWTNFQPISSSPLSSSPKSGNLRKSEWSTRRSITTIIAERKSTTKHDWVNANLRNVNVKGNCFTESKDCVWREREREWENERERPMDSILSTVLTNVCFIKWFPFHGIRPRHLTTHLFWKRTWSWYWELTRWN